MVVHCIVFCISNQSLGNRRKAEIQTHDQVESLLPRDYDDDVGQLVLKRERERGKRIASVLYLDWLANGRKMIQTLTLEFEEGSVFVQILKLEKQTYVYVGMGSLDSMSVAVPGIGEEEDKVCLVFA